LLLLFFILFNLIDVLATCTCVSVHDIHDSVVDDVVVDEHFLELVPLLKAVGYSKHVDVLLETVDDLHQEIQQEGTKFEHLAEYALDDAFSEGTEVHHAHQYGYSLLDHPEKFESPQAFEFVLVDELIVYENEKLVPNGFIPLEEVQELEVFTLEEYVVALEKTLHFLQCHVLLFFHLRLYRQVDCTLFVHFEVFGIVVFVDWGVRV